MDRIRTHIRDFDKQIYTNNQYNSIPLEQQRGTTIGIDFKSLYNTYINEDVKTNCILDSNILIKNIIKRTENLQSIFNEYNIRSIFVQDGISIKHIKPKFANSINNITNIEIDNTIKESMYNFSKNQIENDIIINTNLCNAKSCQTIYKQVYNNIIKYLYKKEDLEIIRSPFLIETQQRILYEKGYIQVCQGGGQYLQEGIENVIVEQYNTRCIIINKTKFFKYVLTNIFIDDDNSIKIDTAIPLVDICRTANIISGYNSNTFKKLEKKCKKNSNRYIESLKYVYNIWQNKQKKQSLSIDNIELLYKLFIYNISWRWDDVKIQLNNSILSTTKQKEQLYPDWLFEINIVNKSSIKDLIDHTIVCEEYNENILSQFDTTISQQIMISCINYKPLQWYEKNIIYDICPLQDTSLYRNMMDWFDAPRIRVWSCMKQCIKEYTNKNIIKCKHDDFIKRLSATTNNTNYVEIRRWYDTYTLGIKKEMEYGWDIKTIERQLYIGFTSWNDSISLQEDDTISLSETLLSLYDSINNNNINNTNKKVKDEVNDKLCVHLCITLLFAFIGIIDINGKLTKLGLKIINIIKNIDKNIREPFLYYTILQDIPKLMQPYIQCAYTEEGKSIPIRTPNIAKRTGKEIHEIQQLSCCISQYYNEKDFNINEIKDTQHIEKNTQTTGTILQEISSLINMINGIFENFTNIFDSILFILSYLGIIKFYNSKGFINTTNLPTVSISTSLYYKRNYIFYTDTTVSLVQTIFHKLLYKEDEHINNNKCCYCIDKLSDKDDIFISQFISALPIIIADTPT